MNRTEIKGTPEYLVKYFPIVRASELSFNDEFLNHRPINSTQRRLKRALITAIGSGLSDFRAQRMDACLDEDGNICFKAGMKPAVGKTANWWKETAEKFMPEKRSRIGTTKERVAFIGLLIKYLIEEKSYTVSDAWKAVCDQSRNLGHYWDSEDSKHELELTGSRALGKWCDLANTKKITINDDSTGGFSEFGGYYGIIGYLYPIAERVRICYPNSICKYGTGWVVSNI